MRVCVCMCTPACNATTPTSTGLCGGCQACFVFKGERNKQQCRRPKPNHRPLRGTFCQPPPRLLARPEPAAYCHRDVCRSATPVPGYLRPSRPTSQKATAIRQVITIQAACSKPTHTRLPRFNPSSSHIGIFSQDSPP